MLDSGNTDIDSTRTVTDTNPFWTDVVITKAGEGYMQYRFKLEWDPAVLAYDDHEQFFNPFTWVCTTPNVTSSSVTVTCTASAGLKWTGPANAVQFHCVGNGTSTLHLGSGTGMFDSSGLPIATSLTDASVTCEM
jgi:hypothetical protein